MSREVRKHKKRNTAPMLGNSALWRAGTRSEGCPARRLP